MKLGELYRNIVRIGMKNDLRPKRTVQEVLKKSKKSYNSLRGREKAAFDKESLSNPYSDTRILYGDHDRDINTLMLGIDIDPSEILLADRLNEKGRKIDLVVSHHPSGRAIIDLYKVMHLQTDLLKNLGMSAEPTQEMMKERIDKVERGLHAKNCMRTIDAAKLIDMPFMCMHTAADNMVCTFLQKMFDKKRPKTLGAIVGVLEGMPEYREGSRFGMGPRILVGDRKKPAGRVYVDMTGGTGGSHRIFARLSQIGIGTVVGMHFSEEHFKSAKSELMNVVVAGHIPSDNLGINLMLDELIKIDELNIVPCSGFMRYERR
ncbi:MAG: NGG1p interacting factor NIF3 [Candidatus Omnitrophota bacterium]